LASTSPYVFYSILSSLPVAAFRRTHYILAMRRSSPSTSAKTMLGMCPSPRRLPPASPLVCYHYQSSSSLRFNLYVILIYRRVQLTPAAATHRRQVPSLSPLPTPLTLSRSGSRLRASLRPVRHAAMLAPWMLMQRLLGRSDLLPTNTHRLLCLPLNELSAASHPYVCIIRKALPLSGPA
jgi:hypothetical protein